MCKKNNNNKKRTLKNITASKDNPIRENPSRQSQTQLQNATPPVRPKESKEK